MAINFDNILLRQAVSLDEIGIEKECLRVTREGRLVQTKHPFPETDSHIDRDFCENQIEFISGIYTDTDELIAHLNELHDKAYQKLRENDELLWSFSNPPFISGEDEIPIAKFGEENKSRELYRNYLADKYGKMKMVFSGIHYNFSFSEEFIMRSGADKDKLYLDLAQKLVKYGWLIVYLTAASPLLDKSYIQHTALSETDNYRYSSVRCSQAGYWNDFIPVLSYKSLGEYIDSIKSYIDKGLLKSSAELYYPIRLKPKGKNSLEALGNGVNHIELRMLDLNPFSRVGILKEDIDFIHLFILWLCSLESSDFTEREQIAAIKNIKKSALYDDNSVFLDIDGKQLSTAEAARKIMQYVCEFGYRYFPQFIEALDFQLSKLNNSPRRYANAVRNNFGRDYLLAGLKLAEIYEKGVEKIV